MEEDRTNGGNESTKGALESKIIGIIASIIL